MQCFNIVSWLSGLNAGLSPRCGSCSLVNCPISLLSVCVLSHFLYSVTLQLTKICEFQPLQFDSISRTLYYLTRLMIYRIK